MNRQQRAIQSSRSFPLTRTARYSVAILGTAALMLLSCVSCVGEKKKDLTDQELVPSSAQEPTPTKPSAPEAPRLTPSEEKDLVKIREWTELGQPLSETDREFLRDPGPLPPSGSTKEAVMAMGYVKLVQSRSVGPSLEQYAREYRVPIAEVIKSNQHVKGVAGAKLVVEAMQRIPVSEEFRRTMVEALKSQAKGWPEGTPPIDSLLPPPPGTLAVPFAPQPTQGEPAGSISLSSPTGDISDKGLLDQAQQLADQGLFHEAILRVLQVSNQSPLKLLAHQKVKEYSQSGIQDLRRKAAQAFQNAGVAPDDRTRLEYLRSARQLLEDGLIMFPEAPQASTVRENLKAITMQIRQQKVR